MTRLENYLSEQEKKIQETLGNEQALLATSGGVDSSVCAALISKAVPGQLVCVFVDHGFMRMDEPNQIEEMFSNWKVKFIRVNAQDRFLIKLAGVSDPEKKRKIIGEEFIHIFEEEANKLGKIPYLAQGTIYPDIIESSGKHGVVKSHHNVGGLPERLDFKGIIEPLANLYKPQVRDLGRLLGLPDNMVDRQPFPGPGLAIRIMGEITREKLNIVKKADAIARQELDRLPNGDRPNQYFAVLTDTYTVGVKNETRTYDPVVAIRAVNTADFMKCEYTPLPHDVLGRMARRIAGEIEGVSRVVYDITDKPPGTLEWE